MESGLSWLAIIAMSAWAFSPPILGFLLWRERQKVAAANEDANMAAAGADAARAETKAIQDHFAPVTNLLIEIARLESVKSDVEREIADLRSTYAEKRPVLDQLKHELALYDDKLSFVEMGVYEPHFDFNDSEAYKLAIREVRGAQKLMVSEKTATEVPTHWSVNGSAAQGRTMVNRQVRLSLRAFNNECEAAIANTRWNNVNAMEARILKSAQAVNKENESMGVRISDDYAKLKLRELYLTHEHREKQKAEKEERAEIARAEREEKRLLAEAAQAEKEERQYQELLNKARIEAAGGVDTEAMRQKIAALEISLAEAHDRKERAQAMAELALLQTLAQWPRLGCWIGRIGCDERFQGAALHRRGHPMGGALVLSIRHQLS
jgi:hypothetical protein